MNCYIVNRKADNFRTSYFTIAVGAYISLCSCAWVICSVCVCVCYVVPVLGRPLLCLSLRLLCLYLVRVFYSSSAICVPGLSALLTFSLPCSLFLCLRLLCCACVSCPRFRLCLRLLCLCLICVFCSSSAVCVPRSFTPSPFFVPRPLRLYLRLLYLCLCLYLFLIISALLVFYFIFTL